MKNDLLSPFTIGKHKLHNRAVVAPMSRVSTQGDGVPTSNMAEYYERYALGKFGMVITEGVYTDRTFSQAYPNQPGITNKAQESGWARVVERMRKHETVFIMQLMHAGALSQHLSNTRAPSAISPLRTMLGGYSKKQGAYPTPHAMNLSEIDDVIVGFVESAKRAEAAGFHGVEIHAANGYLLDQFLTEYTNNREDMYGGSVENRVRLTCQIIKAVRDATHPEFIVGVRISQGKVNDFDYQWPGGEHDAKVIFEALAAVAPDYIHFASEGKGFKHGCYTREGQSLPKLGRTLTGIPMIANGGMHIPEIAFQVLSDGHADLVSLGTGALANPSWPISIAEELPLKAFNPEMFKAGVSIDAQFAFEQALR